MTLSKIGRVVLAVVATAALGLGMTACGSGPIGYLWILGRVNPANASGLISGFTIDNYTGNLTAMPHSPFASAGTNPVSLQVKPGGRFVFVINGGSGVPTTAAPGSAAFVSAGSGISVFSVGGGGILTFEQTYFSQGTQPTWATLDSSGSFLYVLDKYEPTYDGITHVNGSITAYSIAGDTGRLTLVPNTAILTNQLPQSWFEVGPNPSMTKVGSGSCLFTLSPTSIYPYQVNSSSGQLTVVTTGAYQVGNTGGNLSSINTSTGSSAASYTYLTDSTLNNIISLQAGGSACSLAPVAGGAQTNLSGALDPVNSLTSTSGKFLYVLNYQNSTINGNSNSTISAFTINSQGQLAPLSDSTNNPYSVGSGPKCIVQDPSNQYMFISDFNDGTVTGKLLDQNRGYLSDLQRGSVFTVASNPTCLAVSGNL